MQLVCWAARGSDMSDRLNRSLLQHGNEATRSPVMGWLTLLEDAGSPTIRCRFVGFSKGGIVVE